MQAYLRPEDEHLFFDDEQLAAYYGRLWSFERIAESEKSLDSDTFNDVDLEKFTQFIRDNINMLNEKVMAHSLPIIPDEFPTCKRAFDSIFEVLSNKVVETREEIAPMDSVLETKMYNLFRGELSTTLKFSSMLYRDYDINCGAWKVEKDHGLFTASLKFDEAEQDVFFSLYITKSPTSICTIRYKLGVVQPGEVINHTSYFSMREMYYYLCELLLELHHDKLLHMTHVMADEYADYMTGKIKEMKHIYTS